jgi:ABC-2 type transport system permease protein
MAVYEHKYRPYQGPMTPSWSRFLILPRYAYQGVFQSKFFIALLALCFVCPLVMAILIYLHHNMNALALMELRVSDLVPIDASFFRVFMAIQGGLAFLITVIIGPGLVSRDLSNNALPLYLCRPFSRAEYVLGKISVLVILLSGITWIPGLLLFCFQVSLEGFGWLSENLRVAGAVFISSWSWIIVLSLLSMALSAWIKWRIAASAALFGLFTIPNAIGLMISDLLRTPYGNLISPSVLIKTITDGLFGRHNTSDLPAWMVLPLWSAWGAVIVICLFSLFLLDRKLRAYEVVS